MVRCKISLTSSRIASKSSRPHVLDLGKRSFPSMPMQVSIIIVYTHDNKWNVDYRARSNHDHLRILSAARSSSPSCVSRLLSSNACKFPTLITEQHSTLIPHSRALFKLPTVLSTSMAKLIISVNSDSVAVKMYLTIFYYKSKR